MQTIHSVVSFHEVEINAIAREVRYDPTDAIKASRPTQRKMGRTTSQWPAK
jgi:hypothetical protein